MSNFHESDFSASDTALSSASAVAALYEPRGVTAPVADRRYSCSVATVRFHIVPNAKIDKVVGEHAGAIKIKLRAPAVEGKANAALRSFLAEQLQVPPRNITLQRGHKSRDKVVRIDGWSEDAVRRSLLGAGER